MTRGIHTRKRSRPVTQTKSNKRRRFKRRRKTTSYTTKSGIGNSFGFRSRKISTRKYRSMLWRDSIMKTKFRTNFAFTQNQTTPASSAQFSISNYDAMGNTGSPFWTSGGGAISADIGTPVPTFSSDIIVRGGTLGIRITNQTADTQPQEVRVFLFRTGSRQGVALSGLANQPVGFDLTQIVDFKQQYGTVLMSKTALLENSNAVEFKYRLSVQKVDQYEYAQLTKRFYWMVAIGGTEGALTSTATVTQFWNASFVGDAT